MLQKNEMELLYPMIYTKQTKKLMYSLNMFVDIDT